MDIFLQQLINGLVLGSVYALVALGYTMVYGILELINFAHGEITMMGAMVALSVIGALALAAPGLPGVLVLASGLVVAIPVCVALGLLIERVAYRPLRHAPRLAPLITAIGVSIILQNVAMLIWGKQYLPFPAILPQGRHTLYGASITDVQIAILLLATAIMLLPILMVQKTRLGRAMRATAQSRQVASLMGVDVNRVIAATFAIGSALAAVAGVMVSAYYGLAHYYMGFLLGLKAFSAAVLGGIGNLGGAMLGGLIMGVAETLVTAYGPNIGIPSTYRDAVAFFLLILILLVRPSGLLGKFTAEKV